MTSPPYDVVIVEGGVGGLVAAVLLAQGGRRVLVVERGDSPGEAGAAYVRDGYTFEHPGQILWGGTEAGRLGQILRPLGISLKSVPTDVPVQVVRPPHRLNFFPPGESLWREWRREFPDDLPTLRTVCARLERIAASAVRLTAHLSRFSRLSWRRLRLLYALEACSRAPHLWFADRTSLASLLTRVGASDTLREVLQALFLMMGGTSLPPLRVIHAAEQLARLHQGVFTLPGGVSGLAGQLGEALHAAGGEIQEGRSVTALLTGRRRRVEGVVTEDGETLRSPVVVVGIAPPRLGSLLPSLRRPRALRVASPSSSSPSFTLLLGLDATLVSSEMREHLVFLPRPGEVLAVNLSPPWDGRRAPRGQRAVAVTSLVPLGSLTPEEFSSHILDRLTHLFPHLPRGITFQEVVSREEGGEEKPAAGSPPRFLAWEGWPGRTPYPGLYGVGGWTFPGSDVVHRMWGGQMVAEQILSQRL